ncbi:MAG: HAMP domain-containing histidine kinase [Actinobacteria bacterium]|nr:HAMP domain-containing histidine kinase [Actinomycetota bacterium]
MIPGFFDINNPENILPILNGAVEPAQTPKLYCLLSKTESRELIEKISPKDYSKILKPRYRYQNSLFASNYPEIYEKVEELLNEPLMEIQGITMSRAEAMLSEAFDDADPLVFLANNNCFECTSTVLHGNCGKEAVLAQIGEASKQQLIEKLAAEQKERTRIENKMQRFIGIIAHDLRAPLTIVQGQAQISQRILEKALSIDEIDDKQVSNLNYSSRAIIASAKKMGNQITDIVNIARASDQLKPVIISPKDLLTSIASENKYFLEEKKVKLFVSSLSNLPNVRVEKRIFALIQNTLILNAVQAEATEITLNAKEEDGNIIFTVTDNGKGMDEKQVNAYFMPNGSSTGGSGLMTVLAQETVTEDFGGTMSVESEVGKGTTISISIPTYKLKELSNEAVVFND